MTTPKSQTPSALKHTTSGSVKLCGTCRKKNPSGRKFYAHTKQTFSTKQVIFPAICKRFLIGVLFCSCMFLWMRIVHPQMDMSLKTIQKIYLTWFIYFFPTTLWYSWMRCNFITTGFNLSCSHWISFWFCKWIPFIFSDYFQLCFDIYEAGMVCVCLFFCLVW